MPFKSKAQRRKFAQLLVEGKISNETFEEWNRETGGKKLPERVVHRTAAQQKTGKKRLQKKTKKRVAGEQACASNSYRRWHYFRRSNESNVIYYVRGKSLKTFV